MKPGAIVLGSMAAVAILCWVFPPFHVRSLKQIREAQNNAQFNATNFVANFWEKGLLPATKNAAEAAKVLEAIDVNTGTVRERFGRSVGISSSYYLFLRGTGRVVKAGEENIDLSLKNEGDTADISIPLGLVFGNAVRDATGLLSSSDYPNAQEFNDISAGLNQFVETEVLPELQRIAKVGARLEFAGCAEVMEEETDLKPLKLVPVFVKKE